MVVSIRSEATLALGKSLVDQLDLAKSADTLGRWMAHHLAELIGEAEQASARDRSAKMRECRDAVLSLWEHRRALPNGQRPFEDLEPILRAVASLDPNQEASRHFPVALRAEATGASSDPVQRWLRTASDVDYTAKLLIRQCLVQAAARAIDKSAAWVARAEAATFDAREEDIVLKMLTEEREISGAELANEAVDQQRERIDRLETFAAIAAELVTEMKRDLKKLEKRRQAEHDQSEKGPRPKGRKPKADKARSGGNRPQRAEASNTSRPSQKTPRGKKAKQRDKGHTTARRTVTTPKLNQGTASQKS